MEGTKIKISASMTNKTVKIKNRPERVLNMLSQPFLYEPHDPFQPDIIKQARGKIGPRHPFVDFRQCGIGWNHACQFPDFFAMRYHIGPEIDQFTRLRADDTHPDHTATHDDCNSMARCDALCNGAIIACMIEPDQFNISTEFGLRLILRQSNGGNF